MSPAECWRTIGHALVARQVAEGAALIGDMADWLAERNYSYKGAPTAADARELKATLDVIATLLETR